LAQIDDPPADDTVHRRDRAVLDHGRQCSPVRISQQRWSARSLAIDQSLGTLRVEPQRPVAHHLQRHATRRRCLRPVVSVIDHCQRQKPPHLDSVCDTARNPAQ
jgi:hypothetical protein